MGDQPLGATLSFFDFLWSSSLLLAPMLLLGLFLSGLIHVFISRQAILRWCKDDSLKSVSTSAAIGVPVPLCSCSVVPVVAEMRRKGASRSSCMSFLITAPETGADSILVTNAFFGWIVAIVRPVISFITAVVAGIFCIGLIRDDRDETKSSSHGHDHDHDHHHDHDHDHDHGHQPLLSESDDCYISPAQFRELASNWFKSVLLAISALRFVSWVKPGFYQEGAPADQALPVQEDTPDKAADGLTFKKVVKHIFRYGFVEIADDILFALLVGLALGGLLFLAIPSDLMANEYARWLAYPVMVLFAVPLYICASASTPIAAALVAKGFSPGSALIFLMTGPATNTGTIAIIVSQFGAKFASIYVGIVIAVTVLFGIAIDMLLLATGLSISVNLEASDQPAIQLLQWGSALALAALIIWRFRAGALKSGYDDLLLNLRPVFSATGRAWSYMMCNRKRTAALLTTVVLAAYLGTGFTKVAPGYVGYGLLFGEVYKKDLPPGLHYLGPWPFVQVDKWSIKEVKTAKVSASYEFITGDLSLAALSMTMQYRVKDPYAYYYTIDGPRGVIENVVRNNLRTFVSARSLDQLLNVHRATLEQHIRDQFVVGPDHEAYPAVNSIDLVKVNLLEINPIEETINAFREVSSAQEDQERIIVNAQRFFAMLTPQAHGNAQYELESAEGAAYRKVTVSSAEADAISDVSVAVQSAPDVLRYMLWREKLETALATNPKIIVPNQQSLNKVALWKQNLLPATTNTRSKK